MVILYLISKTDKTKNVRIQLEPRSGQLVLVVQVDLWFSDVFGWLWKDVSGMIKVKLLFPVSIRVISLFIYLKTNLNES